MPVDYRLMHASEARAVRDLWSRSPDDHSCQAARFATDPTAHAHTYVAVDPDGTILSTLHYQVRLRNDATGMPHLVGELDSVATHVSARRQGHATRLLQLAIDALQTAGCDWALLVATDAGRPLYARAGWQCYPEPWRRGMVTGALPPADGQYVVRPYVPFQEPAGWNPIARVDMAFNHHRPLVVVRDLAYWRDYAALRVSTWMTTEGLVIFAAFRQGADGSLCGYALAEFYSPGFQVRDLAVLPEEPGATLGLLIAVAAEAQRRGIPLAGRIYLPQEPSIDTVLDRLFDATLHTGADRGQLMARTIKVDFTERQVHAIFTAPGAHFSAIDLF
jgi:GNAT superfamily N-acetyltransferase